MTDSPNKELPSAGIALMRPKSRDLRHTLRGTGILLALIWLGAAGITLLCWRGGRVDAHVQGEGAELMFCATSTLPLTAIATGVIGGIAICVIAVSRLLDSDRIGKQ